MEQVKFPTIPMVLFLSQKSSAVCMDGPIPYDTANSIKVPFLHMPRHFFHLTQLQPSPEVL